jgi:hypothetical protein
MPRLDRSTGAPIGIDYVHHEIHSGSAYHASYTEDLGNGALRQILIVTPDTTKWAHFTYSVSCEAEFHLTFLEAPTATAAANPIVAYNLNRNSANTSGLTITHTPTDVSGGTAIDTAHGGAGKAEGGDHDHSNEWILDQNAKYILTILNETASDNYISVHFDWYEHTDAGA